MLGSPVPMVPLPGVAASALESYSRFLVSGRARDKEIELERYCLEKRLALLAFCRIGSSIFDDLDGFWTVLPPS